MMIHSFPPIADENSRVLILGSIPGIESLRKSQYYGHDRNCFWRIIFELFGEMLETDYFLRTRFLLDNRIALWDVIKTCEREGSLDANIKDPLINDFTGFLGSHQKIRSVYFNGQKACQLFKKYVGFDFDGMTFETLKSTSPAHAVGLESRLENWRKIRRPDQMGQ